MTLINRNLFWNKEFKKLILFAFYASIFLGLIKLNGIRIPNQFYNTSINNTQDIPIPENVEILIKTAGLKRTSASPQFAELTASRDFPFPESGYYNSYYLWSTQKINFESGEANWEMIKAEYESLLPQFSFKNNESPASNDFEATIWERERWFGLEGEILALVWVENIDDDPYLLLLLGIDR